MAPDRVTPGPANGRAAVPAISEEKVPAEEAVKENEAGVAAVKAGAATLTRPWPTYPTTRFPDGPLKSTGKEAAAVPARRQLKAILHKIKK